MEFVSKSIANQNENTHAVVATNMDTTDSVTVEQIMESPKPVICHMNVSNSSESGFSEDNTLSEENQTKTEDNPTNREDNPKNIVVNPTHAIEFHTADLTRQNSDTSGSDISYIKVETIETTEVTVREYYAPKTAANQTRVRNSKVNREPAIYSHNGKIVNGHLRYCINSSKVTDV